MVLLDDFSSRFKSSFGNASATATLLRLPVGNVANRGETLARATELRRQGAFPNGVWERELKNQSRNTIDRFP
jgi:hypothetical protein